MSGPILYSFRRCPYAIRARLALASSQVEVELREILLRDKAAAFRKASPSQTVPTLVLSNTVIDESYDIMHWALAQHVSLLICGNEPHDGCWAWEPHCLPSF